MSNQPSARTVNLVHFPGKDNDDPRALDEYLDNLQYAVTPAMYGGTKDDPTVNNVTAIEAAYAATKNVMLDGIYYVGDGGIELDAAGTIFAISPECGLKATSGLTETTGNGLVNITATGVNVLGMLIDGDDAFRRGVRDTTGSSRVERCVIQNIYSATLAAHGIIGTATAGKSIYRNNIIQNIQSDGGDSDNGAARAILVQTTADISEPYIIDGNNIASVQGEEGDAIQILCLSGSTFYSSGRSIASNNTIRRTSKRAFKIQSHHVTLRDNHIVMLEDLGVDLFTGIDIIDSEDAVVEGNRIFVTSTVRGINLGANATGALKRPVVRNNYIETSAAAARFGIVIDDYEDATIEGNVIRYGFIALTGGSRAVVSENVGLNCVANSVQSFIEVRSTATDNVVQNNTLINSTMYATVRIEDSDNVVTGNKRIGGNYRHIWCNTAGATDNIIVNNIGSSTIHDAVVYGTVTEADQTYVFNNVNGAGEGFSLWREHPDNPKDVSTGATSYDWTGLPDDINEIVIQFVGTSTDDTSPYTLQIGDSGGIETSGYTSVVASGVATQNQSTGFRLTQTGQNASDVVYGVVRLSRINGGNAWTCNSNIAGPSNVYYICQGYKALSGTLDRIRLTTTNGTDVYDAGTVSVRYS